MTPVPGPRSLLQYLADEPDVPLSERIARLPSYRIVKEKVSFPRERLDDAYAALVRHLPAGDSDRSDGLRLAWPAEASWLHVRPSGTEPVVRLIAEAREPASARSLVDGARSTLRTVAGT